MRRAISMAIDKKALMDTVWNGKGTLIGSMAVPTDPWYEDLTGTNPYDPEKAKFHYQKSGHSGAIDLRTSNAAFPGAVDASVLFQQNAAARRDLCLHPARLQQAQATDRSLRQHLTAGQRQLAVHQPRHAVSRILGKRCGQRRQQRLTCRSRPVTQPDQRGR